jgi:hypothetical protein
MCPDPLKHIVALGDKWLFIQTYDEANEGSSMYDMELIILA